jgi:RsiW-degrading membrane proteinase PrsW (M82 family)
MADSRDPIEARHEGDIDLYGIASWEARSLFDRASVLLYRALIATVRAAVVLLALVILVAQVALGGVGALTNPFLGVFTLLSVVPALCLAAFVWYADVTTNEPLTLLVATFFLGVLFAGFAAVGNTVLGAFLGEDGGLLWLLGQILFFYVVVGPIEETVKLLAVRLYAYRDSRFDAVIDGAVYGALAGLGFATIENAIYISQNAGSVEGTLNLIVQGGAVATVRALAGPGHVIYSAFAGYYLGLAKFNPDDAGPIVLKGLLVATFIHATYNTLATVVPNAIASVSAVPWFLAFVGFVVVYDGVFLLLLFRKLLAYRRAYKTVHESAKTEGPTVELTEFDP